MRHLSAIAATASLLVACTTPPPKPAAPPAPLIGTNWKWEGTTTPAAKIVAGNPDRYTLRLSSDGMAAVRADCNRGIGSYEAQGKQISFGAIATTRAKCPPDSQADGFVKSLQAASSYVIDGDRLFIDLKSDSGTMKFTRAE